jgi:uncharacterized protein related to proFAR isomerase
MFRVVFVMDIFNRSVVLAKGGIREKYLPVSDSSIICTNSNPLNLVELLKFILLTSTDCKAKSLKRLMQKLSGK